MSNMSQSHYHALVTKAMTLPITGDNSTPLPASSISVLRIGSMFDQNVHACRRACEKGRPECRWG